MPTESDRELIHRRVLHEVLERRLNRLDQCRSAAWHALRLPSIKRELYRRIFVTLEASLEDCHDAVRTLISSLDEEEPPTPAPRTYKRRQPTNYR